MVPVVRIVTVVEIDGVEIVIGEHIADAIGLPAVTAATASA